jgi:hypothetical protein
MTGLLRITLLQVGSAVQAQSEPHSQHTSPRRPSPPNRPYSAVSLVRQPGRADMLDIGIVRTPRSVRGADSFVLSVRSALEDPFEVTEFDACVFLVFLDAAEQVVEDPLKEATS